MNDAIDTYHQKVKQPELLEVCELLASEIHKALPQAEFKIWHAIPAWFLKENPVVGYNLTAKKGINLLFWSGQAFSEPGLTPEGSFKAAEIKFLSIGEVDIAKLHKWLGEASQKIYNYKDIRKNRGQLTLI